MREPERDPLGVLKELSEKYSQIKLGSGVVGKTGRATLALFFLWAIILWRLSGSAWLDIALLAGGCATTAVYVWWVRKSHDFADKNPGAALLEGAELIEYQKWDAEVKGRLLPRGVLIPNPDALPPPHRDAES